MFDLQDLLRVMQRIVRVQDLKITWDTAPPKIHTPNQSGRSTLFAHVNIQEGVVTQVHDDKAERYDTISKIFFNLAFIKSLFFLIK